MYILFNFILSLSLYAYVSKGDTECPTVTTNSSNIDRRSNKNTLRIVQYNVEWLFIDYCGNSNCPGSGCSWINETEADTHMNNVAKVISDSKHPHDPIKLQLINKDEAIKLINTLLIGLVCPI
jgi:hypothetical protein